MAVTLIFSGDVGTTLIRQHTNSHCVCVEIKIKDLNVILVNQYFQFADTIQGHLESTRKILDDYRTSEVIIMADVNAKSVTWHCDNTDERGEEVELMIAERALTVLNRENNPPTYRGRVGVNSNIDVTLASEGVSAAIRGWKVEDMLTSSDHNMIHMCVEKTHDRMEEGGGATKKYNLRKANWQRLQNEYAEQPPIEMGHPNEMARALVLKIRRAMDASIPKVRRNTTKTRSRWSDRLTELRKEARRKRKQYQRALTADEREEGL